LFLGAPVTLAATRRWRTLGIGALGILITSLAFDWVRSAVPVRTAALPDGQVTAFVAAEAFPPSGALATYTALAVIAGIELPRRWQRAVWILLGVLAVLRVLTASVLPLDIVLAIGIGGVVGSALLLGFGRTVRVASAARVRQALEESGMAVRAIETLDRRLGSWEYRVHSDTGPVRAKVVGWESQQLDALYRAYRRVRLRDVGDDTAYSSARRAVAVEALLSVYTEVTAAGRLVAGVDLRVRGCWGCGVLST
jgi:glycosyltransferase 2 family protein